VTNKRAYVLAALAMATAGVSRAQSERPAPPTVLDGVYTEAQAARGQIDYGRNCARCHGPNLDGGGTAPPLRSATFLDVWREDYLVSLFQHIQTRMPPGSAAGSLPEDQYIDIVAHILAINGFPAGKNELTRAVLETTVLVGKDGPKPLPASATVRVVGCLGHAADTWTLTRSTAPSRVRDGSETNPGELERSTRALPGAQEFRLVNLDEDRKESELLAHVMEKVQVKGVLNGQGTSARIYVLSFQPLAGQCGP
jgi:mono/diheme cytochrome c family protein